ncbi:MAG TPA: porin family protein [Cyclobacteriaceae bacterium]|nr:porin family protein [Cyclobacteriaceae bacterium]
MNTKSNFGLTALLTVLTVMASSALMAQSDPTPTQSDPNPTARVGIKAGLNASNLYVKDVNDENARFGFNGGLYGQILSSESFAIQPELLFSTKGAQADYGGIINSTVRYNLNYLDLPILAVFKLGPSAEIHLGGYASYLLSANIDYSGNFGNGTDRVDRDQLKTFDYGLSGGFGLNFGPTQIGARYNYGLVQIADSNTARNILGNSKNSVAQLYIALNLNRNQE